MYILCVHTVKHGVSSWVYSYVAAHYIDKNKID